ncbi:MAG: DNA polymerase IV [Clostridia bacterium]|nr:DNA polymerase IV [Clostridia bacterium]
MKNNTDRVILHCDCNSFYASCECVLNPKLKNVPMAVCGNPENRHGIILAKNELAKKFNIKTAETIYQAQRKCPELVLVAPHHEVYAEFSARCNDIYKDYTDLVEPFGIDESWLDVTGSRLLFGSGEDIARTIRKRFREELDITCSVGISFNKSMAKLGSDYKKPDAQTVISRENFKDLVWKMPVSDLLYAGRNVTETLRKMYIFTIGDLAQSNRDTVIRHLGKMGAVLHDYANGIDDSPVESIYATHTPKSVSNGMTFPKDLKEADEIKKGVLMVSEELSARMRKAHVKCTTLSVNVKYSDFTSVSKQRSLDYATNIMHDLASVALELLYSVFVPTRKIRAITISGTHLVSDTQHIEQLSLFADQNKSKKEHEKKEKLEDALDAIRQKYGVDAVNIGGLMNRKF